MYARVPHQPKIKLMYTDLQLTDVVTYIIVAKESNNGRDKGGDLLSRFKRGGATKDVGAEVYGVIKGMGQSTSLLKGLATNKWYRILQ